MRETKAAVPSCVEGPRGAATSTDIAAPRADLDGEREGARSGVHASAHRAPARSEDEITLRCSVQQSERLRAIAVAVVEPLPVIDAASPIGEPLPPAHEEEACPSQWNADEEITLDAPVPVSTPASWPELDDPASPEPSDVASTAMHDAAWPELDAAWPELDAALSPEPDAALSPELDAALAPEPSDAALTVAVAPARVPPPLPPRAGPTARTELPRSFPRGVSALVMPTPLRRLPTPPRERATPVAPRPARPGVGAPGRGDGPTDLERHPSRLPDAWTVAGIWTIAVALLAVLALVVR